MLKFERRLGRPSTILQDATTTLAAQMRQRRTDDLNRPHEIRLDLLTNLVVTQLFGGAERAEARVAHDDVDTPQLKNARFITDRTLSASVTSSGATHSCSECRAFRDSNASTERRGPPRGHLAPIASPSEPGRSRKTPVINHVLAVFDRPPVMNATPAGFRPFSSHDECHAPAETGRSDLAAGEGLQDEVGYQSHTTRSLSGGSAPPAGCAGPHRVQHGLRL